MTLSDSLDQMRCAIPGCTLVTFGDMRSGLALRSSASHVVPQDFLEDLVRQAAAHFEALDLVALGPDAEDDADRSVIIATPGDIRVFVRSGRDPSDVMCCLCDEPGASVEVHARAQQVFRDMWETA